MATRSEIEVDVDRLLAARGASERTATHTVDEILQRAIGLEKVAPRPADNPRYSIDLDAKGEIEHWAYHLLTLNHIARAERMSRDDRDELVLRHIWRKLSIKQNEEPVSADTDEGFRDGRR